MTTQTVLTTYSPAQCYTESGDGETLTPPTDHHPDVIAWLVRKYSTGESRSVQCPVCGVSSLTARAPEADIVAWCSRPCMEDLYKTVRECACGRSVMRLNAPQSLPPTCCQQCADRRVKWFKE